MKTFYSLFCLAAALTVAGIGLTPADAQDGAPGVTSGKAKGKGKGKAPGPFSGNDPDQRTLGGGVTLEGYNPNDPRPAARLADGKPDLAGVWTSQGSNLPSDPVPPMIPGAEAIYGRPPRGTGLDDELSRQCMPSGFPGNAAPGVYPMQLVHQPGLLVFLYEHDHFYRTVPTTGGPLPTSKTWDESWMGTSVGRWEGDTLVIDTVGFKHHEAYRYAGNRDHSDELRVTERLTRTNYSTIMYDITIQDPKVFTKPWTRHIRLAHRPNLHIIEYVCEENNTSVTRYQKKSADAGK